MSNIKLKDFCEQNSISYVTGYRWFKNGDIPGAYQTTSGTILIPDDSEQSITSDNTNNAMSLFLKKTVEFSKNNSSVEDFAAYVISNFQLKINGVIEGPKYSKNKPQPQDIQNHFKKFLPDKERGDYLKAMKQSIIECKQSEDGYVKPTETISEDILNEVFVDLKDDIKKSIVMESVIPFLPTQNETLTLSKVIEEIDQSSTKNLVPRKRGRKSSKVIK